MLKKRIPTIIGLLLLIIGAVGGVMFINQGTDFLPRAAPEYAPQKVKITNLSDNGFTVSWITQEPTVGFIKYGESAANLAQTAMDDRDQLTGSSGEYRTHYITIQSLHPEKQYYFKLGSQKNQLYDNNGQPFSITTPPTISAGPPADTAYGTVITNATTPAEGALVYISFENATPLSALVKQNGNWTINLATARNPDLVSYVTYDPKNTQLTILVQPPTGELTNAMVTTENDKPVPTITIGENSNLISATPSPTPEPSLEPSSSEPVVPQESKLSLQPLEPTSPTADTTIVITTLPKDGVAINEGQPVINGKAPANSTLVITMHSVAVYTDQVAVDAKGKWQWTPPGPLEPGDHTVSISYTDEEGILHKLTRHFIVNAAGNDGEPLYSASPSAVVTPTPQPITKPTPTPKPSPTLRPTPTPRTTVATDSATYAAGTIAPTMLSLLFGIGLAGLGIVTLRRQ